MAERYARVTYHVHSRALVPLDPAELHAAIERHPVPLGHLEVETVDLSHGGDQRRDHVPQPRDFGESVLSLEQFSELHRSRWVYRVLASEMEPENLDYLRSALLVAGELGALVDGWIVDPLGRQILDAAKIADVIDRPFQAFEHLALHIESQPLPHWIHTHGMEKFGHADLQIYGVPSASVPLAERLLQHVVNAVVAGGSFRPGEETTLCGFAFEFAQGQDSSLEHFTTDVLTLRRFRALEKATDPATQGLLACAGG